MPKKQIYCTICGADVTGFTKEQLLAHLKTHSEPVAPNSIFGVR
jgi:hypothetical protein